MQKLELKKLFLVFFFLFPQIILANATSPDPCDEIVGHWTGTWENSGCIWEADASGTKYNDIVRLDIKLSHKQPWYCAQSEHMFVGTCKDSRMEISTEEIKLKGYIFSGLINLSDKNRTIKLNKN
ncbi:MAG: hypothetical protein Q8M40_02025 [Legionella sp.]|nr:hypothetical protein [Legionella sp.]